MKDNSLARICVLVSGGGTNLQALLDFKKAGNIDKGEFVLVASTNKNAYALERAKKAEIETFVFDNEEMLIQKLREKEVDFIVLAGFLRILSPEFIELYRDKIINIHPALLPSFGGKGCYGIHVHEKALDYGVKVTGATVHFVNEIPDGGKIIAQTAVYVMPDDTPETLQRRVMEEAEWVILPMAVDMISQIIYEEKVNNNE